VFISETPVSEVKRYEQTSCLLRSPMVIEILEFYNCSEAFVYTQYRHWMDRNAGHFQAKYHCTNTLPFPLPASLPPFLLSSLLFPPALSFLSISIPFLPPLFRPSLPQIQLEGLGSAVSFPGGVWNGVTAEIESDAFKV